MVKLIHYLEEVQREGNTIFNYIDFSFFWGDGNIWGKIETEI